MGDSEPGSTAEDLIIAEEGFVPHAYEDSEGYLTIGFR
jgi:GH24 family phage-related lysozyme (muramidase)